MPQEPNPARSVRQSRQGNPNWRGGRVIDPRGYVLVRVGVDHHLADLRGYAYEHRLVAEAKIGCRLTDGELVHHVNGNKTDNRPENLVVCYTPAEHFVHHRGLESKLRLPGEANPDVPCACGCGSFLPRFDGGGRPRVYISGHNPRPSPTCDAILAALAESSPLTSLRLAQLTGIAAGSLKVALGKMKRQGTITHVSYGVWARKERG